MTSDIATLRTLLRTDLYHRLRPMSGRDPEERGRSATPVELLYDLTYVIAFAAAAEELAHGVSLGHLWPALGAYAFAIFAVTWAWMNFTWFASAYGNDDAMFRVATLVQMIGVVILIFGLPVSFEAAAHGESPNNMLMVLGYVVMRVPLIALWLRAARQDPAHRRRGWLESCGSRDHGLGTRSGNSILVGVLPHTVPHHSRALARTHLCLAIRAPADLRRDRSGRRRLADRGDRRRGTGTLHPAGCTRTGHSGGGGSWRPSPFRSSPAPLNPSTWSRRLT